MYFWITSRQSLTHVTDKRQPMLSSVPPLSTFCPTKSNDTAIWASVHARPKAFISLHTNLFTYLYPRNPEPSTCLFLYIQLGSLSSFLTPLVQHFPPGTSTITQWQFLNLMEVHVFHQTVNFLRTRNSFYSTFYS